MRKMFTFTSLILMFSAPVFAEEFRSVSFEGAFRFKSASGEVHTFGTAYGRLVAEDDDQMSSKFGKEKFALSRRSFLTSDSDCQADSNSYSARMTLDKNALEAMVRNAVPRPWLPKKKFETIVNDAARTVANDLFDDFTFAGRNCQTARYQSALESRETSLVLFDANSGDELTVTVTFKR